jgi:tetratricopeptide (TPR) repeat protein
MSDRMLGIIFIHSVRLNSGHMTNMSNRLHRRGPRPSRTEAQAHQLFGQGLAFHQIGRLEEAAAMYEQAIKGHPFHYDALHLLGVTALQSNHPKRAAELIGKAIEIFPDNPHFHSNRGTALHALNQLDAAVASYDRAIAITPDFAEALFNQGLALADLNKFDAAIASYDRAIALKPDYAEAHGNLGQV